MHTCILCLSTACSHVISFASRVNMLILMHVLLGFQVWCLCALDRARRLQTLLYLHVVHHGNLRCHSCLIYVFSVGLNQQRVADV